MASFLSHMITYLTKTSNNELNACSKDTCADVWIISFFLVQHHSSTCWQFCKSSIQFSSLFLIFYYLILHTYLAAYSHACSNSLDTFKHTNINRMRIKDSISYANTVFSISLKKSRQGYKHKHMMIRQVVNKLTLQPDSKILEMEVSELTFCIISYTQ